MESPSGSPRVWRSSSPMSLFGEGGDSSPASERPSSCDLLTSIETILLSADPPSPAQRLELLHGIRNATPAFRALVLYPRPKASDRILVESKVFELPDAQITLDDNDVALILRLSDELNLNELACLEFFIDSTKELLVDSQDPLKSYWKVAGLWYIERHDVMTSLYILLHSVVFKQGRDSELMQEIGKQIEDLFDDGLRHQMIVFVKELLMKETSVPSKTESSMVEIGSALVDRQTIVEKEKLCLSNCICLLSLMKPMNSEEIKDLFLIVKDSSATSAENKSLDLQVTYRALVALAMTFLSDHKKPSSSTVYSLLLNSSFKHEFHEMVTRTSDNMTSEGFISIVRLIWMLHLMLTQDTCSLNMSDILACLEVMNCQNVLEFLRECILKIATSQHYT